jgi:hypothetical protein
LVGLGSGLWSFRGAAGRSRSGPVARNGKEETGDPAGRAQGDKEGFKRGGRAGEGGREAKAVTGTGVGRANSPECQRQERGQGDSGSREERLLPPPW